jgi:hypothetical protein
MKDISVFNVLKSLHTGEVVGSIPTAPTISPIKLAPKIPCQ